MKAFPAYSAAFADTCFPTSDPNVHQAKDKKSQKPKKVMWASIVQRKVSQENPDDNDNIPKAGKSKDEEGPSAILHEEDEQSMVTGVDDKLEVEQEGDLDGDSENQSDE